MNRPGTDINPDNWPDVNRLFDAAVSLDRGDRDAYLGEACRHDPSLRVAVESLLRAHDEAGTFGEGSFSHWESGRQDAQLVTVTRACATAPPSGPVTLPASCAVGSCAHTVAAASSAYMTARYHTRP